MSSFALIVGSSTDLGVEVSQFLLSSGYTVIGADALDTPINNPDFIDIYVDVSVERSVEEMFQAVRTNTKKLDLIIYVDEFCQYAPLEEISTKEFTLHYEKNLLGPFHVLKHAPLFFIPNQTHIIMISSKDSIKGSLETAACASTKSGLNILLESASEEFKHLGVRVSNILSPGMDIETVVGVSIKDILHIFEMIVSSPNYMEFPKIILNKINTVSDNTYGENL